MGEPNNAAGLSTQIEAQLGINDLVESCSSHNEGPFKEVAENGASKCISMTLASGSLDEPNNSFKEICGDSVYSVSSRGGTKSVWP